MPGSSSHSSVFRPFGPADPFCLDEFFLLSSWAVYGFFPLVFRFLFSLILRFCRRYLTPRTLIFLSCEPCFSIESPFIRFRGGCVFFFGGFFGGVGGVWLLVFFFGGGFFLFGALSNQGGGRLRRYARALSPSLELPGSQRLATPCAATPPLEYLLLLILRSNSGNSTFFASPSPQPIDKLGGT